MKKLKNIAKAAPGAEKRLYKTVLNTGLFLPEWYKSKYPDVVNASMDPLEHYIKYGDKAGRLPNPYFEPNYYRRVAPGAAKSGDLALLHYAARGWMNGRNPSPQFSLKLYRAHYSDVCDAETDPLLHYLSRGQYIGHVPFAVVLEADDKASLVNDMVTINQSGLFKGAWYKTQYADLWQTSMEPLYHFVRHGWRENRKPNPAFDTKWYKDTYFEQLKGANPLVHYITQGVALGNDPSKTFSATKYREQHDELTDNGIDPLLHYLNDGIIKGQKPPRDTQGNVGKVVAGSKLPVTPNMRTISQFQRVNLSPASPNFDPEHLNIHWIIPDFTAGGGGHMTIFRMIHFLEVAGHRQTIWINNPSLHKTPDEAYETILKHFQHFAGGVRFIDDSFKDIQGDAVIATDCWTVAPALAVAGVHRRFYFVQDYEPSFHAMGANYLVAEQTYYEDMDCICAGPWLSELMREKFDRWARHFWLAADTRIYNTENANRSNKVPRIAVYARHFTERRAVELAFLALETLANNGHTFAVDFFGAPLSFSSAPFEFVDHCVASSEELATIFNSADIGLVFSATNYSLVPQEMMASGLPIVELDGESTRAIFPEDTVTFAKPHPDHIATAIAKLLNSNELRTKQATAATEWVKDFSWPDSARLVEEALIESLSKYAKPHKQKLKEPEALKASVVIPTYNAGAGFKAVLDAVVAQKSPWPFEVLVIDSGSTDETLDIVRAAPAVTLHQIDGKTFDHGETRNLGVSLTSGEFIAFLTHDALPFNDRWLHNLVTAIERKPEAAGAFGKHLAYNTASAFTKRDLNAHFEQFMHQPLYVGSETDKKRYDSKDEQWCQMLHFYSDNNSCMRRSVWEEIPYRKTAFGEDQLWADDIIKAGYTKVYAPQATVFHSHDYDAEETFERCKTESAFFKHFFGYILIKDAATLAQTIEGINQADTDWAKENGVAEEDLTIRLSLNEARLKGYLAGATCDTSELF